MSKRFRSSPIVLLTALVLPVGIVTAESSPSPLAQAGSKPIRLDEATMIVEVNATDGDAGLQIFLDGKAWRSMTVLSPDGRRLVDIRNRGRLKDHGLTELFSESSEPSFKVFPLRKFKALFPKGRYTFAGETIHGRRLVGRARLSHDFPDGPKIVSPPDGATVAPTSVVASWNPVAEPAGIDVVGYRAIVVREDPLRVFSVDLPASVTSVPIPSEFLVSGKEYKLEVQVIEASGNQTTGEITFLVS